MDNVANVNSFFNSCQDLVTAYLLFTDKIYDLIFYICSSCQNGHFRIRIYFTLIKNVKKKKTSAVCQ